MADNFTLLSVFSGAGGLDLGFEAAGFKNLGCFELDPTVRATLRANRPGWSLLDPHDVATAAESVSPSDLGLSYGELDVIVGGPPCQPYSKAAEWSDNGRRGLKDDRAEPLAGLVKLISKFSPRAVILENVPGFVRGRTSASEWLEKLLVEAGLDYSLEYKILDASHFGVPQQRRRAILLLIRGSAEFSWPVPVVSDDEPITAWDALHDINPESPPAATGQWAELLPSIPEGKNYIWHTERGGGLPLFGYRTRFWSFLLKLSKSRPSWTIPAQPGPSTGPFHWDSRPLALEEGKRLQTFPDDWEFAGTAREQWCQLGNATPPLLAEVVARSVRAHLGSPVVEPLSLTIPRAECEPPPQVLAAVPERYHAFEGDHDAHPGPGLGPKPRET